MRWKITIEGMDEFDGRDTAEMVIEKEFNQDVNEHQDRQCQATSPTSSRRGFGGVAAHVGPIKLSALH